MNIQNATMPATLDLLGRLKSEMPEIWNQAEVVGKWIWLEFNVAPLKEVRQKLKEFGFHWNHERRCWQHPCGQPRIRSSQDPRRIYPVIPASALELKEGAVIMPPQPKPAKEYKVVALRECPLPEGMQLCDTPERAADYWRASIATNPYFNPECECFAVLMLNTRRRVKGQQIISIGTLDTILVHAREVFRAAIIVAAAAVVLMHNLCVAAHKLCYVECGLMCSDRLTALMLIWSRAQERGMAVLSRTDVVLGSMRISPQGGCHA